MFSGPEQEPEDSAEGFKDFKDFQIEGKSRHFEYNPAAADITSQSGSFPETDDVEAPEKM